MDREEFMRKMDGLGIPRHWYFMGDYGIDDQSLRVKKVDDKWLVYYSERGAKHQLKEFTREEDAYQDLINRLIEERDRQRRIEERDRNRKT